MSFFGLSVLALSLLLGLRRWLWRLRGGWLCVAVRRRLCLLVVAVAVGLFSALRLSVLLLLMLLFSLCPPVLLLYMMARLAGCGGGGPFLSRFVCLVLLVALYKLVVAVTCAVALERALGLL